MLSVGSPGWASARGSVHTSLTTAQEWPWPHFTDQEAETRRSVVSLAPILPRHPRSFSEAGIQARAALVGSPGFQHLLSFQAGRWRDTNKGCLPSPLP